MYRLIRSSTAAAAAAVVDNGDVREVDDEVLFEKLFVGDKVSVVLLSKPTFTAPVQMTSVVKKTSYCCR